MNVTFSSRLRSLQGEDLYRKSLPRIKSYELVFVIINQISLVFFAFLISFYLKFSFCNLAYHKQYFCCYAAKLVFS